jgi:hypothetical protein
MKSDQATLGAEYGSVLGLNLRQMIRHQQGKVKETAQSDSQEKGAMDEIRWQLEGDPSCSLRTRRWRFRVSA